MREFLQNLNTFQSPSKLPPKLLSVKNIVFHESSPFCKMVGGHQFIIQFNGYITSNQVSQLKIKETEKRKMKHFPIFCHLYYKPYLMHSVEHSYSLQYQAIHVQYQVSIQYIIITLGTLMCTINQKYHFFPLLLQAMLNVLLLLKPKHRNLL